VGRAAARWGCGPALRQHARQRRVGAARHPRLSCGRSPGVGRGERVRADPGRGADDVRGPGDVIISNRQLVHGSFANTSPDRRVTVNVGFLPRASVLNVTATQLDGRVETYDAARGHQRSRMIAVAIDARRCRFPRERRYVYEPLSRRGGREPPDPGGARERRQELQPAGRPHLAAARADDLPAGGRPGRRPARRSAATPVNGGGAVRVGGSHLERAPDACAPVAAGGAGPPPAPPARGAAGRPARPTRSSQACSEDRAPP
jgi:hypothetical protein